MPSKSLNTTTFVSLATRGMMGYLSDKGIVSLPRFECDAIFARDMESNHTECTCIHSHGNRMTYSGGVRAGLLTL